MICRWEGTLLHAGRIRLQLMNISRQGATLVMFLARVEDLKGVSPYRTNILKVVHNGLFVINRLQGIPEYDNLLSGVLDMEKPILMAPGPWQVRKGCK